MAHALRMAEEAEETGEELNLLVNLSGRGDKDMDYVFNILGDQIFEDPYESPVADIKVTEVLAEMTSASNEREAGNAVSHH